MTLDELYVHAEHRGIEIDDVPMRAVIATSFRERWVALDKSKIDTFIEEKTVLAHEIGHIETDSFYNIHSPFDLKSKHEKRADKYAIKMLVTFKDF